MKHLALIAALAATEASASSVFFFNDPEGFETGMVDGRPSFKKQGPYLGGKLGCWEKIEFNYVRQDARHQVFDGRCAPKILSESAFFTEICGKSGRRCLASLETRKPAWRAA